MTFNFASASRHWRKFSETDKFDLGRIKLYWYFCCSQNVSQCQQILLQIQLKWATPSTTKPSFTQLTPLTLQSFSWRRCCTVTVDDYAPTLFPSFSIVDFPSMPFSPAISLRYSFSFCFRLSCQSLNKWLQIGWKSHIEILAWWTINGPLMLPE